MKITTFLGLSMRHKVTVALTAGIFAGCSPSEEAVSVQAAPWGDSLLLVEEVRIGEMEGDDAETFGRLQDLAPASDAGVFVADRTGPVVRRFAADGTFRGNVGGPGAGPGEYWSVDAIGVSDEGSLVVIDPRLGRVTEYSAQGAFLQTARADGVSAGLRDSAVGANGVVFTKIRKSDGTEPLRDSRGLLDWGSLFDWGVVAFDGTLESLWPVPLQRSEGPGYVLEGRGGFYLPFVTQTVSAIGPDGSTYWARNDTYRIFKRSLQGDTTVIEREGEEAIPLSDKELREWNARSQSMLETNRGDRDRYFPNPTVEPLIRELAVDHDGRLWVSRYTHAVFMEYTAAEREYREAEGLPDHQWRDTPTWDVFDDEGALLGSVTFPMNTTFVTAKGRKVWGIQAGEHREDYVVRWRIEVAPEP